MLCFPVRGGGYQHMQLMGTTSQTEIHFFLPGHMLLLKKSMKFLMERHSFVWVKVLSSSFLFSQVKPNHVPPVFSLMAIVLLLSEFHLSLLRWEVSGSLFVHNFKILLELLLCFPFASSLTRMALCDKGGKKRVYENIV